MKSLAFITILICCIQPAAKSQDFATAKVKWVTDHLSDMDGKNDQAISSYFITDLRSGVVKWYQKNGTVVFNLKVKSSQGNWPNVISDGSCTLTVDSDGSAGFVTFTRSGSEVSILADFAAAGPGGLNSKFRVVNVSED